MALTVVAAYDVSSDSRRARLAALMQTCGDRIQLSVFVLTIDEDELDVLRDRALAIMDPKEDSLYLLRQCSTCWEGARCVGQAMPPAPVYFWAAL
ncbi:CRISPR-associated endonuclease Cas2 [Micropruina sp.]|uniref:CRISPR-associated endonuclease Cas2 n=1 Tax=Micropruina sp. TaxID=2737536 RepID=UPI0039E4486C